MHRNLPVLFWFIEDYPGKKNKLFHFNITHIITVNKEIPHTFISCDLFHFSPFSWSYFMMYQYIDLKWNSNFHGSLGPGWSSPLFVFQFHFLILAHTGFFSVSETNKSFFPLQDFTPSVSPTWKALSHLFIWLVLSHHLGLRSMLPLQRLPCHHYIQRFPPLTLAIITPVRSSSTPQNTKNVLSHYFLSSLKNNL